MEMPSEQPTVYMPQPHGNKMFSKRNIILIFFLLIVVIALPVGVYLTQKTQIFKSKAAGVYYKALFSFTPASKVTPVDAMSQTSLEYNTATQGDITMILKTEDDDLIKGLFPTWFSNSTPTPIATPVPGGGAVPSATPTPVRAGGTTPTTTPVPSVTPVVPPVATPTTAAVIAPQAPLGLNGSCAPVAGTSGLFELTFSWQPPLDNVDYYKVYYKGLNPVTNMAVVNIGFAANWKKSAIAANTYAWSLQACSKVNGEEVEAGCGTLANGPTQINCVASTP